MNYLYLLSFLPLPMILNRWRGTGIIFSIFNYEVAGSLIYGLYYALLFGFISTWYIGILTFLLYLGAEHQGFGKWVGFLTKDNLPLEEKYKNFQGYNFPYIHQTANFIVREKANFFWYCNIALFFRGFYWGLPLYFGLYKGTYLINFIIETLNILPFINIDSIENISYINGLDYLIVSLAYAIGFPLACYLGNLINIEYKSRFLNLSVGWENQEVVFGFIHFVCNSYLIFKILGV